jgi:hypothetical protein
MSQNVPTTKTVTVANTATALTVADCTRGILFVGNSSAVTVYVGGSDVTTANGLPIAAAGTITISPGYTTLYGIVASSTADVRVMEIH